MRLANVGGRATLVVPGGDDRGVDIAEVSGEKFGPDVQSLYESWVEGIGTIRTHFAAASGGQDAG